MANYAAPTRGVNTPPCHTCPSCGTPAYTADIREIDGLTTGSFLCPDGHGWLTKWLAVAA